MATFSLSNMHGFHNKCRECSALYWKVFIFLFCFRISSQAEEKKVIIDNFHVKLTGTYNLCGLYGNSWVRRFAAARPVINTLLYFSTEGEQG